MSLLQGVLRSQATADALERKLDNVHINSNRPAQSADDTDSTSSDDELITVQSIPGTPASRSLPPTRPTSPTPGRRTGSSALRSGTSTPRKPKSTDPLRVLPSEINQKIFAQLSITQLAKCARVSRKWSKSQTINYVWFQHYRKDNFHDESLPPGKWTRRESKQNWRTTFLHSQRQLRDNPVSLSGYSSVNSGYQTPREIREAKWAEEANRSSTPGKLEMRSMYKELGGRKSKAKDAGKALAGGRDRGGWGAFGGDF